MPSSPTVSVVMPVYNLENYLSKAVESVLNQTLKDFELIILDDCSKDQTFNIASKYAKKDRRIVLVKNRVNLGVTKALNKGLLLAKGKYVIRMDGDDWSYPDRFKLQVELMEKNPNVVVSGSYIDVCDQNLEKMYLRKYHRTDTEIRKRLFRYSPFAHPATIWLGDVIRKEKYDENVRAGQDYELYFRVGRLGKFRNIPKPLLKLRMHTSSVSSTMNNTQSRETIKVRNRAVAEYGYKMSLFDKLYNFAQYVGIEFIPVRLRFAIFNFLRKYELY